MVQPAPSARFSSLTPEFPLPDPALDASMEAISAEARALVGRTSVRRFEVTARDIRRFAQAIGESNPIHRDEASARARGYPGIVAPPLFCQAMTFDDAPLDRLPADGSPLELAVPIPAERAVGGGSEYTIHRLVRAGETITVTTRLKDLSTKPGRSGLLYLVVVQTDFSDQDGLPVASEVATYVKRT